MEKNNGTHQTNKFNFVCYNDDVVFGYSPSFPECFGDNDEESTRHQVKKDVGRGIA